jgi:hypothetical protein
MVAGRRRIASTELSFRPARSVAERQRAEDVRDLVGKRWKDEVAWQDADDGRRLCVGADSVYRSDQRQHLSDRTWLSGEHALPEAVRNDRRRAGARPKVVGSKSAEDWPLPEHVEEVLIDGDAAIHPAVPERAGGGPDLHRGDMKARDDVAPCGNLVHLEDAVAAVA